MLLPCPAPGPDQDYASLRALAPGQARDKAWLGGSPPSQALTGPFTSPRSSRDQRRSADPAALRSHPQPELREPGSAAAGPALTAATSWPGRTGRPAPG